MSDKGADDDFRGGVNVLHSESFQSTCTVDHRCCTAPVSPAVITQSVNSYLNDVCGGMSRKRNHLDILARPAAAARRAIRSADVFFIVGYTVRQKKGTDFLSCASF